SSTNGCFVCGGANPRGMYLAFEQDDAARRIRGRFQLSADYQGATGFIHGGIIATLLDEVMSKANRFRKARAVTAELNVEYLRPVFVGADLIVEGWETEAKGRNLFLQGEIRDANGNLLARGRGRFVDLDAPRDPHAE
ncbi:MAG TPA: PaaI family thioesterase, partial [Verrucomicrobiae bacterium]|nr:PaaI family thioesterase [Verrucomicrobiae bacterium]